MATAPLFLPTYHIMDLYLLTIHLFLDFICILTHFFFIFIAATPEEISPSLDEVYRMIEETTLQRSSSRGQGQSSSNVPADTVSEDTIRSVTPGPVRQQRVVYPPPAEDYEPEFRATKEQTQLYDIVKRFGNARTNSKHMKELKA